MNQNRIRRLLPIAAALFALMTGGCSRDGKELEQCRAKLRDAEARLQQIDHFRKDLAAIYVIKVGSEKAKDWESMSLWELHKGYQRAVQEETSSLQDDLAHEISVAMDAVERATELEAEIQELKGRFEKLETEVKPER